MEFNIEDFNKIVSENPEIATKALEVLKITETGKNYEKTVAETYFKQNEKNAHKYAWDFVDSALKDTLGIEKPQGVTTSEWAKIVAEDSKNLKQQLEALKEGGDSKQKIEDLQQNFIKEKQSLQTEFDRLIKEKTSELESMKKTQTLSERMRKIKDAFDKKAELINPAYDKDTINELFEFKANKLAALAKEEGDAIVWYKNENDAYKSGVMNASIDEVVSDLFSNLFVEKQGGTGSKQKSQTNITNTGAVVLSSEPKTKTDLYNGFIKVAQAEGLVNDSNEYKDAWNKTKEHYNYSALPEYRM